MRCPKCQAENPDEAEYCSLCFTRFEVRLRPHAVDEVARDLQERHQGAMLRCPSCGSLSPLDSQFCLRCGFVFENLEELMVSGEALERENAAREEARKRDLEVLVSEPIAITAESDGAAVMRGIEDALDKGYRARVLAKGRDSITYAMKLLALLGEDMRRREKDIFIKAYLVSEGSVTYLEDVELEMIVDSS